MFHGCGESRIWQIQKQMKIMRSLKRVFQSCTLFNIVQVATGIAAEESQMELSHFVSEGI